MGVVKTRSRRVPDAFTLLIHNSLHCDDLLSNNIIFIFVILSILLQTN